MPRFPQAAPLGIGLLLGALLLRVATLPADPPTSLVTCYHDVASSIFDEGWWTAPARDAALFGRRPPGLDLSWVSPANTAVLRAVFALAGSSLESARGVSVVAGVLGIAILWRLRRRDPPASPALTLAAGWLALSFIASQLGRLALPEVLGTFLGIAAVASLVARGRAAAGLAGGLAGLAFLTKPHFAPLLPALAVAAALLARRHGRSPVRAAGALIAGACVPLVGWAIVLGLHPEDAARLLDFYDRGRWLAHGPPSGSWIVSALKPAVQALAAGTIYRDPLLVHAPVAVLLAAAGLPAAIGALRRPSRRTDVPDSVLVFLCWGVAHGAFLALLPFQPLRYFLPLLPPIAVVAGWALTAPAGPRRATDPLERGVRILVVAGVVSQLLFALARRTLVPTLAARATRGDLDPLHPTDGFPLTGFLIRLADDRSLGAFTSLYTQEARFAALALAALASLALGALVAVPAGRFLRRGFHPETWPRVAVPAMVGIAVTVQAVLFLAWLPDREPSIRDLGRDLQQRLGADPAVVISPGGAFSLSTTLRFDSSAVENGAMFDASGAATHFLALESHPLIGTIPAGGIQAAFPGTERLAGYRLQEDAVYGLYRAPVAASPDSAAR